MNVFCIANANLAHPRCKRGRGGGVGGANSLSRNFDYDALYRLLSATGRENSPTISSIWDDRYRSIDNNTTTAYTQNYQYDKMGNIQQLQHIGNSNFTRNFSYITDTNKLQNIQVGTPNFPFTYDANGNQLTEATRRRFQWDYADRLRSYKMQSGTSEPTQHAHYLYDASGNRVKKLVRVQGGSYTATVYIDGIFEYKTDGTDEQNTLHIMDDKSRIATVRVGDDFSDTTPAVKYNLEDHLGSSTLQLEQSGANINREEYYPFGETSFGSYARKRYKYCGKERDTESGLYYYGARYYNAWTCRFVSCDPLMAQYAHLSPYNYASNSPVTHFDVDGLQSTAEGQAPTTNPSEKKQILSEAQNNVTQGIKIDVTQNPDNLNVNSIKFIENNSQYNSTTKWSINGSGDKSNLSGTTLTNPDAVGTNNAAIKAKPKDNTDTEALSYLTRQVPGPKPAGEGVLSFLEGLLSTSDAVEAGQENSISSSFSEFIDYVSEHVSSLFSSTEESKQKDIGPAMKPEMNEAEKAVEFNESDSLFIDIQTYEKRMYNGSVTYSGGPSTVLGIHADTVGQMYKGNTNTRILEVRPKISPKQ